MAGIDFFSNDAWNDDVLLQQWNTQEKEYQKYHSISKSGKPLRECLTKEEWADVMDLVNTEEAQELGLDTALGAEPENDTAMDDEVAAHAAVTIETSVGDEDAHAAMTGEAEIEDDAAERQLIEESQHVHQNERAIPVQAQGQQQTNQEQHVIPHQAQTQQPAAVPQPPPFPGAPAPVPGQDEAARNMMMSWYYAGFYQGCYETEQRIARRTQ